MELFLCTLIDWSNGHESSLKRQSRFVIIFLVGITLALLGRRRRLGRISSAFVPGEGDYVAPLGVALLVFVFLALNRDVAGPAFNQGGGDVEFSGDIESQAGAANIGTAEEFVSRMLEMSDLVNGTDIFDPQRQKAKEAFASLLMDGLIPSFLELRQIRESVGRTMPAVDRQQLYEDFARKLWKAYKELTQNAVREIGHDIGFLFLPEDKFLEGVAGLHRANPNLREWFGDLLRRARMNWQNDLADFRNNWVEHQKGDRRKYDKFYTPQYAEFLFESAWRTIADILPPLLELHFPGGIRLVEQNPNYLGDRWENRFRFTLPQFTQPKEN